MAKEVKFHSEGIGLVPTSADPSNPAQGQLQYSDGTARAEGLWRYNGTEWVIASGSGGIISDWVDFPPTGTWTSGASYTGQYRRVGGDLEGWVEVEATAVPSPDAHLVIDIPAGLSIDASKLPPNVDAVDGHFNVGQLSVRSSGQTYMGRAAITSANITAGAIECYYDNNAVGSQDVLQSVTVTGGTGIQSGDFVKIDFKVPIVGWSTGVLPNEISEGTTRITRLSRTNTVSLPDNTFTKLPFTSGDVDIDTTAMYNSSLDRVDILETGYYDLKGVMNLSNSPFVERNVIVEFRKNGLAFGEGDVEGSIQGNTGKVSNSSLAVYLESGDYLELWGYQNDISGSTAEDATAYSIAVAKRNDLRSQITPAETVAARYTSDNGQTINNATTTLFTYEDKDYDTHNSYSSGIYTAPISGIYQITASVGYDNITIDTGETVQISIRKNLSDVLSNTIVQGNGTTTPWSENPIVSDVVKLSAGDTIEIRTYQNSGTTGNTSVASNRNVFSIIKVGN